MDELREALVAVYGTDYGLRSANWISRFTDMARQAASYRHGRVPPAVLIRPDGHVAWAGELTDPELPQALATWFGAATPA
jgi:hypothetical protein